MDRLRTLALLLVAVLVQITVGKKCDFPISGLPVVNDIYYQPDQRHPNPMATITFTTSHPVIQVYWMVGEGGYGWITTPRYSYYPVYDTYNGITVHDQALNPSDTQILLYSDHPLGGVSANIVLDIGCNTIVHTFRFKKPARRVISPITPYTLVNLPQREQIVQQSEWFTWQLKMTTPSNEYSHNAYVAAAASRKGSVLNVTNESPWNTRNGKDGSSYSEVNFQLDVQLKPRVSDVTGMVHGNMPFSFSSVAGATLYYPFSARTAQESKPAIAFSNCRGINADYLDDDGSSTLTVNRRSDTPGCFNVHLNGNPFPEYTIKDLATGQVFRNSLYTLTETYTEEQVTTPPIPDGQTRNYQVTAQNSQGSVTRQITLVGYTEKVLSTFPARVRIFGKDSVQLSCKGYGNFRTLGLYQTSYKYRLAPEKWRVLEELDAENNYAEIDYTYSNKTTWEEPNIYLEKVFCVLDRSDFDIWSGLKTEFVFDEKEKPRNPYNEKV